jgi:hypothetical protein
MLQDLTCPTWEIVGHQSETSDHGARERYRQDGK